MLSNAQKITAVASELKGDLCLILAAMKKVSAHDSSIDVNTITNMLNSGLQVSGIFQ